MNVNYDLQSCCRRSIEGIGCLDLESIINASVIKMVTRAMKYPDLPWMMLTNDLIIESASVPSLLLEAIKIPWLQWLSSGYSPPGELRHIWGARAKIQLYSSALQLPVMRSYTRTCGITP